MPIIQIPDSYTELLIHSDSTDGNTTFVDSSESKHTITAVGTARHDDAQKKFGATAMEFDGNSDYLTIADASDFQMGTDDWTIDYWVRPGSISGTQVHISGPSNDQLLQLRGNGATLNFELNGASGAINTGNVMMVGVWQHLAAVRVGDVFYAYHNGVLVGSDAISGAVTPTAARRIGARDAGGGAIQFFYGHLDEFRASKGIARWKENFTPPTRPYSKIDDDYSAAEDKLVTVSQLSDGKVPDGPYFHFDGSNDYIDIGTNGPVVGRCDYSIECWIKPEDVLSAGTIIGDESGDNDYIRLQIFAESNIPGRMRFAGHTSGNGYNWTVMSEGGSVVPNVWQHVVAIVDRDNTANCYIFINGKDVTETRTLGSNGDDEFQRHENWDNEISPL
jgi:hypothetical protein